MMESDELFARRLQAEELGLDRPFPRAADYTPLIAQLNSRSPENVAYRSQSLGLFNVNNGSNNNNNNNNINNNNNNNSPHNSRQNAYRMWAGIDNGNNNNNDNINNNNNESNNPANQGPVSPMILYLILMLNVPQIIAGGIVMALHWDDAPPPHCSTGHEEKWKIWATISVVRMILFCVFEVLAFYFKQWLEEHLVIRSRLNQLRHAVDVFSFCWFFLGNMWIIGDDYSDCKFSSRSPVYNLCLSMLIINYIQLCFPCIVAIVMIPVFFFCMPTLVRFLNRINGRMNVEGADNNQIDTIPTLILGQEGNDPALVNPNSNPCSICLNDFATGEHLRNLPCKHIFHKQCVDEWLRLNATCPTCRESAIPRAGTASSNNSRRTLEMSNLSTTSSSSSSSSNSNSGGGDGGVSAATNGEPAYHDPESSLNPLASLGSGSGNRYSSLPSADNIASSTSRSNHQDFDV